MAEPTDQGAQAKMNKKKKPAEKGGILARLFAPGAPKIEVRVCPIEATGKARLDSGVNPHEVTAGLISMLRSVKGIRAKITRGAFKAEPGIGLHNQVASINTQSLRALRKAKADVFIWGEIGLSEDTVDLYFVSLEQGPGFCHGVSCAGAPLTLPLPLDLTLAPVFIAVTLGAVWMAPASTDPPLDEITPEQAKDTVLRAALSPALEQGIQIAQKPPHSLKLHDRATLQGCFAGAVAKAAQLWNQVALFRTAADLHDVAIRSLARDVASPGWALAQRNLGVVQESLGDRKTDSSVKKENKAGILYQAAAVAYRAALGTPPSGTLPADRAWIQFRLGQALYKAGQRTGDTELLSESMTSLRTALELLPTTLALPDQRTQKGKKPTPPHRADGTLLLFRSEIMNAIGQVAQYYGGEEQNPALVKESVQAFRSALEIRSRDRVPHLWATTQNNIGSALFLLGRLTGEEAFFRAAKESFSGAHQIYADLGMPKMASLAEKNLSHVTDILAGDSKKAEAALPPLSWDIGDAGDVEEDEG